MSRAEASRGEGEGEKSIAGWALRRRTVGSPNFFLVGLVGTVDLVGCSGRQWAAVGSYRWLRVLVAGGCDGGLLVDSRWASRTMAAADWTNLTTLAPIGGDLGYRVPFVWETVGEVQATAAVPVHGRRMSSAYNDCLTPIQKSQHF